MADVFISHSSKDKETADKVVAYLEERGISCWIAPRNIVAGSDWEDGIPLDGCTVTEQDKDGNLRRTGLYKEGVIEWQ